MDTAQDLLGKHEAWIGSEQLAARVGTGNMYRNGIAMT